MEFVTQAALGALMPDVRKWSDYRNVASLANNGQAAFREFRPINRLRMAARGWEAECLLITSKKLLSRHSQDFVPGLVISSERFFKEQIDRNATWRLRPPAHPHIPSTIMPYQSSVDGQISNQ